MRPSLFISWLLPLLLLAGCGRGDGNLFHGYIEAEPILVACSASGILQALHAEAGERVQAQAPLFELDATVEQTELQAARAKVEQAESRLDDLKKGARESEIASLQGRLAKARSEAEAAERDLTRLEQLHANSAVSDTDKDHAATARESSAALVLSLEADLKTAESGAREDLIRAAAAEVDAAQAGLKRAEWALAQKRPLAVEGGVIDDVYFRVGELVPAGRPILSLLPPSNVTVRFFVPQARLPSVKPGSKITISADGWKTPRDGTVTHLASEAEFTPPVIYSRENREKFVFRVEANIVAVDESCRPGLPVDVTLSP